MMRDMELVRELLLKLGSLEIPRGGAVHLLAETPELAVNGKTPHEIEFHLEMLRDAGFIDEGGFQPAVGIGFRNLTWLGYDFVDALREDSVWHQTKEIAKKAGGYTADILVDIGKALLKQKLKQLGLDVGE